MVEPRQSALQRIQVGLIGLVVVLLFVSLANMVLDRVSGGPSINKAPEAIDETQVPDEPLAELGVTPVASEEAEPITGDAAESSNNAGQQPAGPRR